MKPAAFEYVCPHSLEEAVEALAKGGADAKLLAGGQSLIPLLNFRLARPSLLSTSTASLIWPTSRSAMAESRSER